MHPMVTGRKEKGKKQGFEPMIAWLRGRIAAAWMTEVLRNMLNYCGNQAQIYFKA